MKPGRRQKLRGEEEEEKEQENYRGQGEREREKEERRIRQKERNLLDRQTVQQRPCSSPVWRRNTLLQRGSSFNTI